MTLRTTGPRRETHRRSARDARMGSVRKFAHRTTRHCRTAPPRRHRPRAAARGAHSSSFPIFTDLCRWTLPLADSRSVLMERRPYIFACERPLALLLHSPFLSCSFRPIGNWPVRNVLNEPEQPQTGITHISSRTLRLGG